MGKRKKLQEEYDDDYADDENASKFAIPPTSSDDEEGNVDLSSKIVEKALLRASNYKPLSNESNNNGAVVDGSLAAEIDLNSSPSREVEAVADLSGSDGGAAFALAIGDANSDKKIKKEKKKKKMVKKIEFDDESVQVEVVKEDEKVEIAKAMDIVASMEPNPVETSDNIVLRKLLRGPRYFDPPDSSWGTCYNCGEEGHLAVNCTGPKRKKPCFVCGSLEHSFKKCSKGQDCFICKKGGHRAKDCPEKYKGVSQSSKMCLICGHSGHDMFSCENDYSPDDLKEIQCYVCNNLGHLCCVNFIDAGPREVSCFKCGQLGHTGLVCARSHWESTEFGTPSSCFRCGEEGHFARECTSSSKVGKRSREYSTPSRTVKGDKTHSGFKSEPHDLGKTRKKKKMRYEERDITTPRRLKQRGGWVTEDPGDVLYREPKENNWMSYATPTRKSHKLSTFTACGQNMGSRSYKKVWKNYSGASTLQGSAKAYRHRFSASRFGNSSSDGRTRNYDWW